MASKNLLLSIFLITCLTGCIPKTALTDSYTYKPTTPQKLLEKPSIPRKIQESIHLVIDTSGVNKKVDNDLEKTRYRPLPLIIYNQAEWYYDAPLLKEGLYTDFDQILVQTLKNQSSRDCLFQLSDSLANTDYTLEISIDSVSALGDFYIFQNYISIGPLIINEVRLSANGHHSYFALTYTLRKENGQVIKKKSLKSSYPVKTLKAWNTKPGAAYFLTALNGALWESTGESIHAVYEQLIKDLNAYAREKILADY